MALIRNYIRNSPTFRASVTYDDVTTRISSVTIENDSDRACQISVYTSGGTTPVISYTAMPLEYRTWNVPGGQNYFLDSYDISFKGL